MKELQIITGGGREMIDFLLWLWIVWTEGGEEDAG